MMANILVVGLGLIGGSMAKAIKTKTSHHVIGMDISSQVVQQALEEGSIDASFSPDQAGAVQVVLVSLYPKQSVDFVKEHIGLFSPQTLIVDLCGIKQYVCSQLDPICQNHGLFYIGGHPMAGREFSGYQYSLATLFEGASMILTPGSWIPEQVISQARELFLSLGFGKVVQTSPKNHDKMIAFTSQLAHVVSNAYIKSPEADQHVGYSAGSYKDLTRVAKLNEDMWTDLFLLNKGPLLSEIENLILHLSQYRDALEAEDAQGLKALLRDGRLRKEKIDNI